MNFKSLSCYIIVFIKLLSKYVCCSTCSSFENIYIEFNDSHNARFNQTINGCIQQNKFYGKDIVAVFIEEQNTKILAEDSISNMIHLKTASFSRSGIERILPGAFRNVPELENVHITYNKVPEILNGVFNDISQLKHLQIDHNQINEIETEAFANLTNLKSVSCKANILRSWSREWFRDSESMDLIDFSRNKIKTIPRRAFAAMPNLRIIYFDFNEIETIYGHAFKGLTNLVHLGLNNNRLKEMNNIIFPHRLKMHTLAIGGNYLNYLPDQLLNKISVQEMSVNYNPWKCPCLDQIHKWMYRTNATLLVNESCNYEDKHLPVCAVPKSYPSWCSEYVDSEVTERYLTEIRKIFLNQDQCCVRLD